MTVPAGMTAFATGAAASVCEMRLLIVKAVPLVIPVMVVLFGMPCR